MATLPTFTIVVQGDRVAASFLENMGERALAPRPALEEIYLTMLDIVDEIFEKEGARGGAGKWVDLTFQWAYDKARRGADSRILREFGGLHHSMTTFRHPEQYVRIEKDKIVFSSRLLRGKVHQQGGRTSSFGEGIPPRPYIKFTEEDRLAFAREVLRYLTRKPGTVR